MQIHLSWPAVVFWLHVPRLFTSSHPFWMVNLFNNGPSRHSYPVILPTCLFFLGEYLCTVLLASPLTKKPFVRSNTNEGANWSAGIPDPAANTSTPNATEDTVFNFIQGQYDSFTPSSLDRAFELYPLQSFNTSVSLQGQQMYGEMRYICTAALIAGSASRFNKAFHFQ